MASVYAACCSSGAAVVDAPLPSSCQQQHPHVKMVQAWIVGWVCIGMPTPEVLGSVWMKLACRGVDACVCVLLLLLLFPSVLLLVY